MRGILQRYPMGGWVLAAVLMLAAAFMAWRNFKSDPISQMTELVTIRCTETGETWQVPRGVLEKQLFQRPFPVDPNIGVVNPKTGKPTGFPVDDWKRTVDRINFEREALRRDQSNVNPPAPTP